LYVGQLCESRIVARVTTRPVIPRLAWAIFALLLLSACGTEVATDPAAQSGVEPHDPPPTIGRAPTWRPAAPQLGPCTKAGTALTVGPVESALGHRAIVVEVCNCGRSTLSFDGHMTVKLLDVRKRPIPVNLTITPSPGSPSTTFKADVDLGNTGKLELTAWSAKLAG
jgi:Domain of unknown function (DUF4232)